MIKLPENLYYIITDNSIEDLNHKYSIIEGKIPKETAKKNRQRLKDLTKANEICFNHQVHGNQIYYADSAHPLGAEPDADGFYTDKKGLLLAVRTADCVPVIFYSSDGSFIGAAHAGWRGAKDNILENLYNEMKKQTSDIAAFIGPCIHQKSYEVDFDFYNNFVSEDIRNDDFFKDSAIANYFMFDLKGYVIRKLSYLGIQEVQILDEDTYSKKLSDGRHKYPSYRRHTHYTEDYPMSIVTGIMIKP